jgi:hypothetical protein
MLADFYHPFETYAPQTPQKADDHGYDYQKSLIAQLVAAKELKQSISKGASNAVFGRVFHQQSILV